MLSNISWMQFFTGMGSILVIYYLYVLVRYYPDKLKGLFAGKKGTEINPSFLQHNGSEPTADAQSSEEEYDEFKEIENLVSTLQDVIREGSENINEVGDFKKEIAVVLRRAYDLRESPYRPSINELIKSECSKYRTFTLSEREVDALWDETV